jgi:hypothetical protein
MKAKKTILPSGLMFLAVLLAGCTEEAPTSALQERSETSTTLQPGGDFASAAAWATSPAILRVRPECDGPGCLRAVSKKRAPGAFASPLFGLATAPNNDILVADAGSGISQLQDGGSIPEIFLPGVTAVDALGRGTMWATTGAGADPTTDTGQALYRVSKGTNRMIANLFNFEQANLPDGGDTPDSNPYDVASLGGRAALVVDAGGNDLLRVDNQGNIEVLAIFPVVPTSTDNVKDLIGCPNPADLCGLPEMFPTEPVPTSVAIGPDGYYYVGELRGFPAPTDASSIWKVSPNASGAVCGSSPDCVKVFDGGFTSIIDLAFDDAGILHVAELDERSWFAIEALGAASADGGTINACDVVTATCIEVATGIPILTAITFGLDGSLWATENALIPGLAGVIAVP